MLTSFNDLAIKDDDPTRVLKEGREKLIYLPLRWGDPMISARRRGLERANPKIIRCGLHGYALGGAGFVTESMLDLNERHCATRPDRAPRANDWKFCMAKAKNNSVESPYANCNIRALSDVAAIPARASARPLPTNPYAVAWIRKLDARTAAPSSRTADRSRGALRNCECLTKRRGRSISNSGLTAEQLDHSALWPPILFRPINRSISTSGIYFVNLLIQDFI